MGHRTDSFLDEFTGDLLRALPLNTQQAVIVRDVQVCEIEASDGEVRYRIGLQAGDGSVQWFISEDILFVPEEDDAEVVERTGNVLEGLQEDRVKERLRECGVIE